MHYKSIFTFYILLFTILLETNCNAQALLSINVSHKEIYPIKGTETDEQKYERWSKIKTLFHYARNNKINLFFPTGVYDVGNRNFPFRTNDDVETDELLDCGNIIIYGEGGTVFKTSSVYGADVLQLNKVKNITFKNLEITAELQKYEKSGSNGISLTNGFDNITLENINIYNLPGVDKETWVDGSKGLTIQSDIGSKGYMGSLMAKNIRVENVAYGFRMDTGHVSDILKNHKTIKIDLEMTVKKAFQGFSIEFGKSLNNISREIELDINAKINLANCQQYIRFARVIGGNYEFKLDNSQTYKQSLKDNNNKNWVKSHDGVFGFLSYYTKNAKVYISGKVGEVDNKIWIGAVGSIVEPYNLKNRTENNIFNFDIDGKAKSDDIRIISFKGESLHNNEITLSKKTTKKIPKEFYSNSNILFEDL